jgi:hypothetical protein
MGMSATMVHLAVAHAVVLQSVCDGTGEFYLGTLAPDAVHLRSGMQRQEKRRTHFYEKTGASPRLPLDLDRIRQALCQCWEGNEGAAAMEGYAVHLLTDAQWHDEVILPYRERIRGDGRWDEMPGLYYRDCDAVDGELFICCPWRPEVWTALRRARPQAFDGLLTAEEVSRWRDRSLARLEADSGGTDRWPLYLETPEVLAFVKKTAADIGRTLSRWRGEFMARADREATA